MLNKIKSFGSVAALGLTLGLGGCSEDVVLYEGQIPSGTVKVEKDVRYLWFDNLRVNYTSNPDSSGQQNNYFFFDNCANGKLLVTESNSSYVIIPNGTKIIQNGMVYLSGGEKIYTMPDNGGLEKHIEELGNALFSRADSLYQAILSEVNYELEQKYEQKLKF